MLRFGGSKWAIGFWSAVALWSATQFNACSQAVNFKTSVAAIKEELLSSSIILINDDAQFTNDKQVEVTLQNNVADEVYLTNDPQCSGGGTWLPIQAKLNWTLASSNREVAVYASFRNKTEGVASDCVKDTIVHDSQKPKITLNDPNLGTNVPTPIFQFVAYDEISGIKGSMCTWPGQAPVLCSNSSSNGNLNEGIYQVEVIAEDRAGNFGDPTFQAVTVDRTAPVVVLNGPPSVGTSTVANFIFTATDGLSGVKRIECSKENTTSFQTCVSPLVWNVSEGQHVLHVRAVDNVGNVSPVVSHPFNVDVTAPNIEILSGPTGFVGSQAAVLTYRGMDSGSPISNFKCRMDGGEWSTCNGLVSGVYTKNYSGLAQGVRKFEVQGFDAGGNPSGIASRQWTVDTIAPAVAFTVTPDPATRNLSAQFRYTITDSGSGPDFAECSLNNAAFATCNLNESNLSGLAVTSHNFRVRGVDKAGNRSGVASYTWVVDTGAPTLVLTNGPADLTKSATERFQYTASDNGGSGIDRVDCRLDSAAYAPCDSVSSHTFSGLTEGNRRVAIRAIDKAGNLSNEVVVNWKVDLTLPEISYFQLPTPAIVATSRQRLGFTVEDANGIESYSCKLNGAPQACVKGEMVELAQLSVGNYNFVVTARDNAGNSVTDTKSFSVLRPTLKNQTINVNENNKVDIVVIIDNSGSMSGEMASMGSAFTSFISKLDDLDWQLGIITTDARAPTSKLVKSDGRLVELNGAAGQYILKSSMNPTQADTLFRNTIQMPTDGDGNELGIASAIRTVNRAFDGTVASQPNANLLRPDAALAFIVVSDAYDNMTQPNQLIDAVKARWGGQKAFSFHSIVVPKSQYTNPSATQVASADPCKGYRESVKYDGRSYHDLSDLTGGIKGTVCTTNYSSQLSAMGQKTVELVNAATLDCQPVDANGDGQVDKNDVTVTLSSGQNFTAFTLAGNKLTFATALPAGDQRLTYYCLQ